MIEKKCPHCGAAMPEEAHYCLQCMMPCTPALTSTAYRKRNKIHCQKRINRKQLSSVLAAVILVFVLIPSVLAAPVETKNALAVNGAITGTLPEEAAQAGKPQTLLSKVTGSVIKAAKKASKKMQSTTGKLKEAVGIDPTAEEQQAMAEEEAEQNDASVRRPGNSNTGEHNPNGAGNDNHTGNNNNNNNSNTNSNNSGHSSTDGNTTDTDGAQTTTTTTTTLPSTRPETTTLPRPEYSKFTYQISNGRAEITAYTGNAKVVVLPSEIDGYPVSKYLNGALTDKDAELIVFEDFQSFHTLWVQSHTFTNCKKVKKIVFPKNADLGILSDFAYGCTALSQIEIQNGQYKMQNGVLYYYNSGYWAAQYYCEGYTGKRWNVPEFCEQISCDGSLRNNTHIQEMRLNTYCFMPSVTKLPDSLQAVYVAKDNPYFCDIDGVVYYRPDSNNPNLLQYYPASRPNAEYTIPNGAVFDMHSVKNKHLKTLVIPKGAIVRDGTLKYICLGSVFPNLQTIKVESGSPHADYIKRTFTGKVIVY